MVSYLQLRQPKESVQLHYSTLDNYNLSRVFATLNWLQLFTDSNNNYYKQVQPKAALALLRGATRPAYGRPRCTTFSKHID